jgi:hypothetical protein
LKDGTDSSQGKGQLLSNINAANAIADSIRTTLGPRGMDKLIVDSKSKNLTRSFSFHVCIDRLFISSCRVGLGRDLSFSKRNRFLSILLLVFVLVTLTLTLGQDLFK